MSDQGRVVLLDGLTSAVAKARTWLDDAYHGGVGLDAPTAQDETAPFGLPNSDPWTWPARWDAGEQPGSQVFR
ncbi:hypothetical protein ACFOOM_04740 [Streptomyces echinoruber]|uniref:Uncharacterized protein n=1 Tax=Streptomyces echinoruber TaxID=68898 RepID=A0A918R9U1_9ACTN|nr:hypothetical protein [Streptomyces echinoruber]GGZ91218.1 hypothetical protein GCM10010389_32170 [Streptomyces echinoruber]